MADAPRPVEPYVADPVESRPPGRAERLVPVIATAALVVLLAALAALVVTSSTDEDPSLGPPEAETQPLSPPDP